MISIHVIAEDLSPSHLLAAVKHWASKFEQEIANVDEGPSARGAYHFEHDGKATEVHWHPSYAGSDQELTDSDREAFTDGLQTGVGVKDIPLTPVPPLSMEAANGELGGEADDIVPATAPHIARMRAELAARLKAHAEAQSGTTVSAGVPTAEEIAAKQAAETPPPEALAAFAVAEQQEGAGATLPAAAPKADEPLPAFKPTTDETAGDMAAKIAPDLA